MSTPLPGPELTVIVPTRNERDNVAPLYQRLCAALEGVEWEVIFVDDDSRDGTAAAVRGLAQRDRRVRLLHRLEREGLASACVEGIQASASAFVAVMDGDLQHDERLLRTMLDVLRTEPVDLVVGSRYVADGDVGEWGADRVRISRLATWLGRRVLRAPLSDPMSGFFALRRDAFEGAMRRLSGIGFKILLDIVASSPKPLRIKELPFQFRPRHAGASKFDTLIAWEYLVLLADKLVGRILPVRFVLFALVGALGVLAHLVVLWLFLRVLRVEFAAAQTAATLVAMVGNFALNNWLTYRDVRLQGRELLWGLLSFCLVCSVGAAANIGVASVLFAERHSSWWLAGIAGAVMSLVWNYTMTSLVTWRRRRL